MYVYLTDTIYENTCKIQELLHDKKRKQKIYKKAVAEALSLGTGGSAGTACNLLFWWLPSHCYISNFLFQMSWVTRNQNKAYLISYHCLPPCQSGSHQWSFPSLLQLFQQQQSADAAGHGAFSAHLWTLAGHSTGAQRSHFFCSGGPQAVFNQQLLCLWGSPQLPLGSTPLSVMQAWSKPRLPLLRSCCTSRWLTALGQDRLKQNRYLKWPGEIQRGSPVNTANETCLYYREIKNTISSGIHKLRTNRSFSYYTESSFVILSLMQPIQCYQQPLKLYVETCHCPQHYTCSLSRTLNAALEHLAVQWRAPWHSVSTYSLDLKHLRGSQGVSTVQLPLLGIHTPNHLGP